MRSLALSTMTMFVLGFTAIGSGDDVNYPVPYYSGPTIDGTVTAEEMAAQLATPFTWPEIEDTGGTLVVAQSGTEHENVSATFYTSYDETHLYISAVALDNTPYYDCCESGGPMNANDIIQPTFNPFNDHDNFFPPDPGGGPAAIYDVAVQTLDEFGPDIYRHGALFKDGQRDAILDGGLAGTIQVDANGDQTGYTLELALPWAIAMDDVDENYVPKAGDEHGYGFLMIGEEFGGDPVLLWDAGHGADTIGDASTWNKMTLMPKAVEPKGLLAYYNFDDGQTVTDQVGNNHGTVIFNAGFNADTPDGSAFSLDLSAEGVGPDQDYVRIGPEAEGGGEPEGRDLGIAETNSFTIAGWVNYKQSQRGVVTIKQDLTSTGGDRSGITVGIDGSGQLFVGMIASTGDEIGDEANSGPTFRDIKTDDFVPTDEWVHIAATFDFESDTLVGYINGLASESYTVNPADSINEDGTDITGGTGIDWFDNDGSFTGFGAAGNGPVNPDSAGDFTRLFYDGLLDDVGIWDLALSAEQIASLADGSMKPPQIFGPGIAGDFNGNGVLDIEDINMLVWESAGGNHNVAFDLTSDGVVNRDDVTKWIKDPNIGNSWVGDANFDGEFNSSDLVVVFQGGKFELNEEANWAQGDWTGDHRFNSGDLVAAFQDGGFEQGPRGVAAVPEPSALVPFSIGLTVFWLRRRRC